MKGNFREYTYRKPLTPSGIKGIDKGTLEYFDVEMYANFNTGTLEQYFEEKTRREGFRVKIWSWPKVLVGLLVGIAFAAINQYVGLKIGMIVGGSWYIAYLIGMALRWKPTEINISSGVSTGASMVCTGFVFTFPAIYFIYWSKETHSLAVNIPMATVIVSSILAAFLGVMYFIIFRRVWLVEDPLPMPGFQAWVKLLDMAHDISAGAIQHAKRSLLLVGGVTGLAGFFTFLRDFPLIEDEKALFDVWFGGSPYYAEGDIQQPLPATMQTGEPLKNPSLLEHTHIAFNLSPIMLAVGWFMELRAAFLVNLGTLFSWFIVIPLAIALNIELIPGSGVVPTDTPWPAMYAYANGARIMGIGAILGGGFWALIKMAPTFRSATADLFKLREQAGLERRQDFVSGKGWYEWPITHILLMIIASLIGVSALFIVGGFPAHGAIVLGILVAFTTFFLGAIAVKVMGETSVEPVSGTSFIVLLMLFGAFKLLGIDTTVAMIMALLGTTVFGGAISMSGDIITDFKNAIYIGNRPFVQMKGELIGIVPGMVVAGFSAILFSIGLAEGKLNLLAPQAHAFEKFANLLMGGQINYWLLLIGAGVGILMDVLTGMGTAFGLGMYFPLSVALPMLTGGMARHLWEHKWLNPKAEKEKWDEKKKTLTLLDTYMIATGMTVGEAVLGTIVAIYHVLPLVLGTA